MSTQSKYTISGNSIEEMALSFAELIVKTSTLEVVKAKTEFAVWKLDDGTSDSPIYKSMTLDAEQAAGLATKAGAPLALAIDVRLLNLTPVHTVQAALSSRKAASIQRITKQLDRSESLREKLARLQS